MAPEPVDAHIEAQARLRRLLAASLTRIWADLPGHDRENVDEWLSRVLPVVSTGQRSSVALTDAYIAQVMARGPIGPNVEELIGAAVRNGTPPAEVYERPFITLWSKLGAGLDFDKAASAALSRATGTAAMDVQLSMRATADAIDTADPNVFGYRRKADASACAFCKEVDGAYVKASAGFAYALHNGCGCSLVPNPEPHQGAVALPDGTVVRPYAYGPLNDNVAVRKHGELGAVLVDPADKFTALADI